MRALSVFKLTFEADKVMTQSETDAAIERLEHLCDMLEACARNHMKDNAAMFDGITMNVGVD